MASIVFKFPTRSRPQKFKDTLNQYIQKLSNKHNYYFIVSMDNDDKTMNTPEIRHWLDSKNTDKIKILYNYGNSTGKIQAVNADLNIVDSLGDYSVIMLLSDDMIPKVDNYDDIIIQDMLKHYPDTFGVIHYNDGKQGRNLNTLSIMGRKMFEYLGKKFYHSDYISLWCDNEFMDVTYQMGKCVYIDKIIVKHEWVGQTVNDQLHRKNESFMSKDRATYEKRKSLGFPMESIF